MFARAHAHARQLQPAAHARPRYAGHALTPSGEQLWRDVVVNHRSHNESAHRKLLQRHERLPLRLRAQLPHSTDGYRTPG